MNNEFKDYYRILGVTPDASQRNIEIARDRELSQNWSDPSGRLAIQEAYVVLSDPVRRREYDAMFNERISERDRSILNARTFEELRNAQAAYPKPQESQAKVENPAGAEVQSENQEEVQAKVENPAGAKVQSENQEEMESKVNRIPIDETNLAMTSKVSNYVKDTASKSFKYVKDIALKSFNYVKEKNVIGRALVGSGIILVGGFINPAGAVIGIPVAIVANKIITKIQKAKLQKDNKVKKITDIRTTESRLFDEYNEKLENQIYELLSRSHSNYKLEIAILKYRNQVELLENRIKLKKSEVVKKGGVIKFKLELSSLEKKLEKSKATLAALEKKVTEYKKESKLSRLNEKLYEKDVERKSAQAEIKEFEEEGKKIERSSILKVKKLQVQFDTLKKKRDKKANKMVLNRKGISGMQALLVKHKKDSNVGTEVPVEESVKTR